MIKNYKKIIVQSNGSIYESYKQKCDTLIIDEQEQQKYISQINKILSQPKNINFGNLVYTSNLSNIPRFKFKEFIKENKLKRTSIQEYCETIIIDKSYIKDALYLFENLNESYIIKNTTDDNLFNKFINAFHKNKQYPYRNDDNPTKFTPQNTLVYLPDNYKSLSLISELRNLINSSQIEHKFCNDFYRDTKLKDTILLLDFLQTHPNINIIFDEWLLETLNSDGLNLDDEYIESLENMFKSNQNDSIKLAIEMLSNINLNESNALTIALLLNKHQHVFTHGSGITPSSMNSFKILDKYYKSRGIIWKNDWKHFAKGLYKNYQHNAEHKQIIEQFVLKNTNEIFLGTGFHINSFDLAFQG